MGRRLERIHFAATGFIRPGAPLVWAMLGPLPGDRDRRARGEYRVHAVNATLVTMWRCGSNCGAATRVAAGTIFLLGSGLSEAIVWASGVQDVLMTTLVLAAVALATARPDPKIVAAITRPSPPCW